MRLTSTDITDIGDLRNSADLLSDEAGQEAAESHRRIALLTPYTGNNLGDAAIQDAMIANLRLRLPGAQFSGISLNCDNFLERHGVSAFPLCGTSRPFHGMSRGKVAHQLGYRESDTGISSRKFQDTAALKRAIRRLPLLGRCVTTAYAWGRALWNEFRHCVNGYQFLRCQDLLIVSGGGQLDDEWGGPWGHPFTLFKWAILAWIAQIPYVIASVGVCKVTSTTSRLLLSATLRIARYRSYRDRNSKEFAVGLLPRAAGDSVVPDLAFSLPAAQLPPPAGIRAIAQGRTIVAISPMAYARPGSWPYEDQALYGRYLQQLASVMSCLLKRDCFLVIVWSAMSDKSVIPELLECLDLESKSRLAGQMLIPAITGWKDLVALLLDMDFLLASRLHSVVLGFVAQLPTVAISFDPKVDWVMADLGQTDYLLRIRDFTAEDVMRALDCLEAGRESVTEQIVSYRERALSTSARQYDALAELARGFAQAAVER